MNDQLQHYGIKGMKWGVRKYRNQDGSYTKAGVKRYDDAMNTYEKRLSEYKSAKESGVKGDALRLKKSKVRSAKRDVKKHYNHLRNDKMADKGKIRYGNGQRITTDKAVSKALGSIGSMAISAAIYGKQSGLIKDERVTKALYAIGGASIVAGGVKEAVDYIPNNQLRAYYSHTSKY